MKMAVFFDAVWARLGFNQLTADSDLCLKFATSAYVDSI